MKTRRANCTPIIFASSSICNYLRRDIASSTRLRVTYYPVYRSSSSQKGLEDWFLAVFHNPTLPYPLAALAPGVDCCKTSGGKGVECLGRMDAACCSRVQRPDSGQTHSANAKVLTNSVPVCSDLHPAIPGNCSFFEGFRVGIALAPVYKLASPLQAHPCSHAKWDSRVDLVARPNLRSSHKGNRNLQRAGPRLTTACQLNHAAPNMSSALSKRQQARNEKVLQDLLQSVPGNNFCADCQARNPGNWPPWTLCAKHHGLTETCFPAWASWSVCRSC